MPPRGHGRLHLEAAHTCRASRGHRSLAERSRIGQCCIADRVRRYGRAGKPFDRQRGALRELLELDTPDGAYVAQLVAAFLENADRLLRSLSDGVREGDPEAVERAAHALKGSSSNIGAPRLAELARRLETLGRGRALGQADEVVEEAGVEFERVGDALREAVAVTAIAPGGDSERE